MLALWQVTAKFAYTLPQLISKTSLWNCQYYYHPYFIVKETIVKRVCHNHRALSSQGPNASSGKSQSKASAQNQCPSPRYPCRRLHVPSSLPPPNITFPLLTAHSIQEDFNHTQGFKPALSTPSLHFWPLLGPKPLICLTMTVYFHIPKSSQPKENKDKEKTHKIIVPPKLKSLQPALPLPVTAPPFAPPIRQEM